MQVPWESLQGCPTHTIPTTYIVYRAGVSVKPQQRAAAMNSSNGKQQWSTPLTKLSAHKAAYMVVLDSATPVMSAVWCVMPDLLHHGVTSLPQSAR